MARTRINLRLALVLLLALAVPAGALAHGGHVGPTQIVTQAIGPYELSISIELPQGAPAPLYLVVIPQQDMDGATITLRTAPRGQSFVSALATQLRTIPSQPLYNAQLEVDRAGDWELEVQVAGGRGGAVARIPFSVVIPPLPTTHIHAAERMPPPEPLASTTRYGPDIRFAYTFPQPGRYQLWGQFRRAGATVIVPLAVEVAP